MTLWSGRFSSPMAESLWDLSESYSFDHVLYAHDIRGTGPRARPRQGGALRATRSAPPVDALDEIAGSSRRHLRARRR
jgi:argininosuccinate lyase